MNNPEMPDALSLKDQELQRLKADFDQYQQTSKAYQAQMQEQIDYYINLNSHLKASNQKLTEELRTLKKNQSKKICTLQMQNDRLIAQLQALHRKLVQLNDVRKQMETEMDAYAARLRQREFQMEELTTHYHDTLEELALACSELQSLKEYSAEKTFKLKENIIGLRQEVEATQRRSISKPKIIDNKLKASMIGRSAADMVGLLIQQMESQLSEHKQ